MSADTPLRKLIDTLRAQGRQGGEKHTLARPAAVLWPDKESRWLPVIPALRAACPALLTCGDYDPELRTGPAIWLKSVAAGLVPETPLAEDFRAVIYLPGTGRDHLNPEPECPEPFRTLCELQYRGVIWLDDSRDMTPETFLRRECGVQISAKADAKAAFARAMAKVFETPLDRLQANSPLNAQYLDILLTDDPHNALLEWLAAPGEYRAKTDPANWAALVSRWKADLSFDAEASGAIGAAERLMSGGQGWDAIWARVTERDSLYGGIKRTLAGATPDLGAHHSRSPGYNAAGEAALAAALTTLPTGDTLAFLKKLDAEHGDRRNTLWAAKGDAPFAVLLGVAVKLAETVATPVPGADADAMRDAYAECHHRTDTLALELLAQASRRSELKPAAHTLLDRLYLPWLDAQARRFQHLARSAPGSLLAGPVIPALADGECLFFVDGLRLDLAQRLALLLRRPGQTAAITTTWSALPSLTATAKWAVTPIATSLAGADSPDSFEPRTASGSAMNQGVFKSLLAKAGVACLDDDTGDPAGRAWCETGDLDTFGHDFGTDLAVNADGLLEKIAGRIRELRQAGWATVRVVTDHGWLLAHKPFPKQPLGSPLALDKSGRCARLKPGVATGMLELPWRWNPHQPIAYPEGVACLRDGECYAHGGLSLQECVIPILTVSGDGTRPAATVSGLKIKWKGLRATVEVTASGKAHLRADLRTKQADPDSSVLAKPASLDATGKVSLFLEDDSRQGEAATLVILDDYGNILAKSPTTLGDN